VGPPHCATIGLTKNFVECDLDAKSVQLLDDILRALVAQRAELRQPALERLDTSEVQREEMDLVIVLKRAQLTTGDDADAESITRLPRCCNPGDAVVVGER